MEVLGIGDYYISNSKEKIIKTYSLGSCVAITIHCPVKKVTGMAHIALPYSTNEKDIKTRPAYFANTAIPLMLHEFSFRYGCNVNNLQVGIFGGALSIRKNDVFRIGQKNVESIKEILRRKCLPIQQEDVGGFFSRTVEIQVSTGKVKIHTNPIII
ncbi:chemotaxis protein CheD [Clostridium grantii]|uniref:Probable chemoreceptor glutamine deamidase CheD n=1 Tax=Clostridium grantii DSM 8605 TaxID=1121316 RepID=A0A1M5W7C5_9CLOT|nr:chemotaxis protein CheD [Clostridium grantii]SHH83093.1 chemotaxis protein CheD [Clostridium grantii DSM 8605]